VAKSTKRADERIAAKVLLNNYDTRFRETKNPVFAWAARDVARRYGEPEPASVTSYLDRVAARMHAMLYTNIPDKDLASPVYRALEFQARRSHNPFRAMVKESHDQLIALRVLPQILEGKKLTGVLYEVAQEHPAVCGTVCHGVRVADAPPKCESLDPSTVARIWKRFGPRLLAAVATINASLESGAPLFSNNRRHLTFK
jgi:hypothetical protein